MFRDLEAFFFEVVYMRKECEFFVKCYKSCARVLLVALFHSDKGQVRKNSNCFFCVEYLGPFLSAQVASLFTMNCICLSHVDTLGDVHAICRYHTSTEYMMDFRIILAKEFFYYEECPSYNSLLGHTIFLSEIPRKGGTYTYWK